MRTLVVGRTLLLVLTIFHAMSASAETEKSIALSMLLIETSYMVREAGDSEKTAIVEQLGAGFFVNDHGLAIAPQHVIRPWLYDRETLALVDLSMIDLVPGSARFRIWPLVSAEANGLDRIQRYEVGPEFTLRSADHRFLVLYYPDPSIRHSRQSTNYGMVNLQEALTDATDIIVLQLLDLQFPFKGLELAPVHRQTVAAEDVSVVGINPATYGHDKLLVQIRKHKVGFNQAGIFGFEASLQPGASGSPVLNSDGELVGMVIAAVNSDSENVGIGIALVAIHNVLARVKDRIRKEESRLADAGCQPGKIDGIFDRTLMLAIQQPDCEYFQSQ